MVSQLTSQNRRMSDQFIMSYLEQVIGIPVKRFEFKGIKPGLTLASPVITLSGRASTRVPFGTGPAINKISTLQNPDADYGFYHPDCFLHLKNWLAVIPALWENRELNTLIKDELLLNSLITIGAEKAVTHALNNSSDQKSFIKHMHNWFDAFRTLKLIHQLRDTALQSIELKQLKAYQENFPFIAKAE